MCGKRIVLIARAPQYSPNSVDKDWEILSAVRRQLLLMGCHCSDILHEEVIDGLPVADVYLSMARMDRTLTLLQNQSQVANTADSVDKCKHRSRLMKSLELDGFPVPPLVGNAGYWVKRGDNYTMCLQDVQYATDERQALTISLQMRQRGIAEVDVRAHVEGDLLKCYGVYGSPFFRYYYPADTSHYAFDSNVLHHLLENVAFFVGLSIYGCDCIIQPDGTPVIIDVNDWPSFSHCREEAAVAIAESVIQKREDGNNE